MRRSLSHTLNTASTHYVTLLALRLLGRYSYNKLIKDCQKAESVNEATLLSIINRNKDTSYGRDHRLSSIKSKTDFKNLHPLTRHEHYASYIDRVENGEQNVMNTGVIKQIGTTSGTSGSVKHIPMLKYQAGIFFLQGVAPIYYLIFNLFKPAFNLQKTLKVMFEPEFKKTKSGFIVGPNSSRPSDSPAVLKMYSSPPPVYTLPMMHSKPARYLHLLYALSDSNLGCIEANFANSVFELLVDLENNWVDLVEDIRQGSISKLKGIPHDMIATLESKFKLQPNPTRAQQLQNEFSKGFQGILKRIWPHMNLILCCDTGSFELYGNKLKKYTSNVEHNDDHVHHNNSDGDSDSDNIPIFSPIYAATEGLIGIALDAHDKQYCLCPRAMYFEFIPEEHSSEEQPQTIDSFQNLKIGHNYELVISTYAGLYRYRFGDVVKVTGFKDSNPLITFQYRQGQVVDLRGEKTTETALYRSIHNTSKRTFLKIVDYTTIHFTDIDQTQPRYYFIVEFVSHDISIDDKQRFESVLDESLKVANAGYKYHRNENTILEPRVIVVRHGTFRQLYHKIADLGNGNANQVKIPRYLKNSSLISWILKQTDNIK
eukprot:TRINITY_DN7318_c0_g1_i1.p1 TRINITY_DN7318_c0_g1~~TRINITY_DN7318_c0_g1_i1.p1  ORF type:complete len:599 (+),score=101.79 TRINITY_DN7318_c0_g1_i1:200-1996(+)